MTLADAVSQFEAKFDHVVSFVQQNDSHAPNGQTFDIFAPGLKFKNGVPDVRPYPDGESAIAAWSDEIAPLADGKTILYWRINPHILQLDGGVTCVCSLAFGVSGDSLAYA